MAVISLANSAWIGIDSSHLNDHCGFTSTHFLTEALDGTDYWSDYTTHTHWFILDLGTTKNVAKVRGRSNGGYDPTDINIYVSDDMGNWGVAVASGISVWQDTVDFVEVNINSKRGRYVKIEIVDTESVDDYLTFGATVPFTIFDVFNVEVLAISGASGILSNTTELQASSDSGSGAVGVFDSQTECAGFVIGTSDAIGVLDSQSGLGSSCAGNLIISGSFEIHSYLVDEQSVEDGEPVELYLFDRDSGVEYWRYTSSDLAIVYDGETYEPELIRRGDIVLDANSLKTRLEIEVDLSNVFARNFISDPIEGVIQLTIYRQHFGAYVTYWKGYIQGVKFKSKTIAILAGLKNSSLKRFGLMRKYQRSCGFPLFSTWCTILKTNSDFYVDGTVNSVSGTTIDATVFSTKTNGWFKGGIFKTDNGNCLQKIVYHDATRIKIPRTISALAVGDTFRAWAGCDHLKATCKDKFDNKLNYGGQPYLPDKNPFTGDAVM